MAARTRPDLAEALLTFDELERVAVDRRRANAALRGQLALTRAELEQAFGVIEEGMVRGLTIEAAAARANVSRRALAGWIEAADGGREPWCGWLARVVSTNAERRLVELDRLRELAALDARQWTTLQREQGRPDQLEYSLRGLRGSGARGALAAILLEVAPEGTTDSQSPADGAKPSEPQAPSKKGRAK